MSEFIKEITNFVAVIKINRTKVYNALTRDAKLELISIIREYGRKDDIKAIVLTGEGAAFCTGQDLNDRTVKASTQAVDLGLTLETEWNPLVMALKECPKITIAAVNGVTAGAGISVALACDLVVSKPQIKFVSGFSKIGLCPDAGSTALFTRAIGPKRALEFFIFSKPLMSEDLKECGLINKISEQYLEESVKWAEEISKMAPLSVKVIKKNIQVALDLTQSQVMERETQAQRFLGNSQDYQEGLSAFFEKRPANFKGQ